MDELVTSLPFYRGARYRDLEKKESVFGRAPDRGRRRSEGKPKASQAPRVSAPRAEVSFAPAAAFGEYVYKATPLGSEVRGIRRLELAAAAAAGADHVAAREAERERPVEVVSRGGGASASAVRIERL
jgi:hypothetical protein